MFFLEIEPGIFVSKKGSPKDLDFPFRVPEPLGYGKILQFGQYLFGQHCRFGFAGFFIVFQIDPEDEGDAIFID